MKRFLFLLLAFIFSIVPKVSALELTNYSKSAILIEPSTGTIIYELNKDERLPPASMTKLMTMLLIMESLDENKISLNDMVLISNNASAMGGSQVFLEANSQIAVEQLLKGIAIASGNDAAVAMAEHISGSTSEFVNLMNKKAKDLGLKNTNFVNVHGLDADNHYSSAFDMAIIAKELIKHENILNYTSLYEDYLVKPDGSKTWLVNTNKLVRFYEGVDGLKTGYTSAAKYCLTSTAQKNDIRFISVVMGADTAEYRNADTTSMLNYGFVNYKLKNIVEINSPITTINVSKGQTNYITAYSSEKINDLIKQNEEKNYSYNIVKYDLVAPVNKNDVVGQLEVVDNNGKVIKIVDLISLQKVKKHNFVSMFIYIIKNIVSGY